MLGCPSTSQAAFIHISRLSTICSFFCTCHVRLKNAHTMGSGEQERILLTRMRKERMSASLTLLCYDLVYRSISLSHALTFQARHWKGPLSINPLHRSPHL